MWRPRSLRLRYTLRALLVFITLFMLWGGYHANRAWRERQAEAILRRGGASFEYGNDLSSLSISRQYERVVRCLWRERYITRVSIHPEITTDEADAIASLPHLRLLWLQPHVLSRELWSEMRSPFRRSDVPAGALAKIMARSELSALDVSFCQLSPEDFAAIGKHDSLECLWLNSSNLSDAPLSTLLSLPRLREILFVNTRVTGVGLASLPGSASLKSIGCDGAPVGIEFAAFVRKCPRITILGVRNRTIDDAFVRTLSAHPSLEYLTLGPLVTDAVVDPLLTMPNLKAVDVREAPLSHDARARLVNNRPTLRLN